MLCVRCERTLVDVIRDDADLVRNNERAGRIPCRTFRRLLGAPPEDYDPADQSRSAGWVRMCMRAILTAKLEGGGREGGGGGPASPPPPEHALVGTGGNAAGGAITRFPDLVWAWFATPTKWGPPPPPPGKKPLPPQPPWSRIGQHHVQGAGSRERAESTVSVGAAAARADRDRWEFFEGLRRLVHGLPTPTPPPTDAPDSTSGAPDKPGTGGVRVVRGTSQGGPAATDAIATATATAATAAASTRPRGNPSMEAAQFWAMLDETHGSDAGAFHINCLEVLEASLGPLHRRRYHGGRLLGCPTEVSAFHAVAHHAYRVGTKQHKARERARRRQEKNELQAALRIAVDDGDQVAEERIRELLQSYADLRDDEHDEHEEDHDGGEGKEKTAPDDQAEGQREGGSANLAADEPTTKAESPHAVCSDEGVVLVIEPPPRVVYVPLGPALRAAQKLLEVGGGRGSERLEAKRAPPPPSLVPPRVSRVTSASR